MSTPVDAARQPPRPPLRWPTGLLRAGVGAAGVLVGMGVTAVAIAGWSATGGGSGTAAVGTLAAPSGVTVSSVGSTVSVSWDGVVPPQGALAGYIVTRFHGSTPSPACGTDPAQVGSYVPAGTPACTDAPVSDGTYTYAVTAVFRTWTAQSARSGPVAVEAPTQAVSLAAGSTGAVLNGTTLYYRPGVAGGFRLVDAVTSAVAGPASATFPDVAAAGWSHPGETVSVGSGGPATIAYQSSAYSWNPSPALPVPQTVTGRDTRGATVSTTLTLTPDAVGPTGGALTVNGVPAGAAETSSHARTTFPIDVRTDYGADAGSGLSTNALTVETATLSGDSCGAYSTPTVITGAPAQAGLTTGCYRYRLTGTDAVGNTSTLTTVVKYDLGPPTQTVTLVSGVNASQTGNVIYFRGATGSFVLASDVTDTETSPASVTFPVISTAGWTHAAETDVTGIGSLPTLGFASSTYSLTSTASTPGTHSVVGKDAAGNSVTTALTFSKDTTAPTGGALTVNAGVAASGGSTTFNKTGGFTIGLRTDYTDAGSGLASSVLTVASATLGANTCGTFGPTSVVNGSAAQSGLTTGCYRYTLTGTDKVGNQATPIYTTVKVDLVLPTGGAVTVNGVAADTGGTTASGPTNDNPFPIDARTDWTDAESGLLSSTLTRAVATYTAGGCGTFSGSTTVTGTTAQSGLATSCYRYTLAGTDNAGNVATVATVVRNDVTLPTGGALTVNAVAASTAGSSSLNRTGAFTIGARTDYTDAASGIDTSILSMTSATLSGGSCGTFGAATVVAGAPSQAGLGTGCYRYTLTGTDLAGNVAVPLVTTVKVDLVLPTGGAMTVNGVAADAAGTTSGPTNDNPFLIDSRTDWTDAESGMGTSLLTRTSATYSGGLCTGTYATPVTNHGHAVAERPGDQVLEVHPDRHRRGREQLGDLHRRQVRRHASHCRCAHRQRGSCQLRRYHERRQRGVVHDRHQDGEHRRCLGPGLQHADPRGSDPVRRDLRSLRVAGDDHRHAGADRPADRVLPLRVDRRGPRREHGFPLDHGEARRVRQRGVPGQRHRDGRSGRPGRPRGGHPLRRHRRGLAVLGLVGQHDRPADQRGQRGDRHPGRRRCRQRQPHRLVQPVHAELRQHRPRVDGVHHRDGDVRRGRGQREHGGLERLDPAADRHAGRGVRPGTGHRGDERRGHLHPERRRDQPRRRAGGWLLRHRGGQAVLTGRASPTAAGRPVDGAGDGNRTRMTSLEGWSSAIELHPQEPCRACFAWTGPWL